MKLGILFMFKNAIYMYIFVYIHMYIPTIASWSSKSLFNVILQYP